jgi:hypothetical protein
MWYQVLASVALGMIGILAAVMVGGWLVFKAKTITMPTEFLSLPKPNKRKGPTSYMDESLKEDYLAHVIVDDALSPAAARLRGQGGAALTPEQQKAQVMAFARGKK